MVAWLNVNNMVIVSRIHPITAFFLKRVNLAVGARFTNKRHLSRGVEKLILNSGNIFTCNNLLGPRIQLSTEVVQVAL